LSVRVAHGAEAQGHAGHAEALRMRPGAGDRLQSPTAGHESLCTNEPPPPSADTPGTASAPAQPPAATAAGRGAVPSALAWAAPAIGAAQVTAAAATAASAKARSLITQPLPCGVPTITGHGYTACTDQ
jgi:hypothetical protein